MGWDFAHHWTPAEAAAEEVGIKSGRSILVEKAVGARTSDGYTEHWFVLEAGAGSYFPAGHRYLAVVITSGSKGSKNGVGAKYVGYEGYHENVPEAIFAWLDRIPVDIRQASSGFWIEREEWAEFRTAAIAAKAERDTYTLTLVEAAAGKRPVKVTGWRDVFVPQGIKVDGKGRPVPMFTQNDRGGAVRFGVTKEGKLRARHATPVEFVATWSPEFVKEYVGRIEHREKVAECYGYTVAELIGAARARRADLVTVPA